MPYAVIKYASILKALKSAAASATDASGAAAPLHVSLAAPSVAAFDIHDHLGSSDYWCAIQNSTGANTCGYHPPHQTFSELTIAGNLKGIYYDIANYTGVNQVGYQNFTYQGDVMDGLF